MKKLKFEIPASVQAELDARDVEQKKATAKALENGVFQLKYPWANENRGVPNDFLRSALFGVVRRGRREVLDGVEIAAWGDSCIRYTGAKLMQSDQDVWMACVEACKRAGSTQVEIGQRDLMRLAGRKGGNTGRLFNDIKRLAFAGIEISGGQYRYAGTLLQEVIRNEETGKLALSINPKMAALFGAGATHIGAEQRHALSGDLSKWLHGYVLSHKSNAQEPHIIRLQKVQELCGSQSNIRDFRRSIKKSLKELEEKKIIVEGTIENDVLKLWR